MNNHMSLKLVGANSSLELNSPITSIYLQEELTGLTTLPGIRETKGMNIGMDGGWTSAQFYEPRLITIKGVIANQDVAVVEQRRKQLIQLLSEKRLALEFQTEAGNHYTMDVVVAGVQMPLSKVLTASYFQINLRADDPLIYDNNALAELEAILRRSSSASSGFTINFPINFQLGTSESRPTIDNFGSSVIYPTITLTGPLTTPEIVNITTNMAFTIDEVLGAGTYTASGIRGAIDQEGSIDTYSGNPIQATRDAESPISKFSLYGNAEQTTYSGKNLFDTSTATLVNKYVNTNGAMTSASDWLGTDSYFEVQPNTTYTFSAKNQGARFLWGEYETTSGSDFISPRHESTGTFTTGSSTHYIRFSTNNANATDLQIERGSTATSYEPFVGGTPAPNPDYPQPISVVTGENVVKITGKNLLSLTPYRTGSEWYNLSVGAQVIPATSSNITLTPIQNGVQATISSGWQGAWYICEVAEGQTYTFKYSQSGTNARTTTYTLDETHTIVRKIAPIASDNFTYQNTITIAEGEKYFALAFGASSTGSVVELTEPQLELGSTATSYEPYQGHSYTINLGSIELAKIGTYQDRIYKSEGKWYIEKQVGKVVLDGTEDGWGWADTARYTIATANIGAREAISDHFAYVNYTGHASTASPSFDIGSNLASIGFHDKDITSLANFKTWLASNPTTVYYVLATPTTAEITNEALIDQLDAVLEAHLYEGVNNISNVTAIPNLSGGLEIKTGQTLTVINSLSIVGSSGSAEIGLGGSELAMVGGVADELTINGTTGAVTKTTRIGKIASYAGETITTDYISTSGGLDSDATIYYVLPSSSTSVINTLDSTALTAFNNVVASGGVSAQTNIGSISVDVTTVTTQDVAVVDTKQHTVTINGVGAYSKFSGDWLTLDVGLNELQLITENNTDTGSAVIKYRVGYMGV